jgi:hypothetical protein
LCRHPGRFASGSQLGSKLSCSRCVGGAGHARILAALLLTITITRSSNCAKCARTIMLCMHKMKIVEVTSMYPFHWVPAEGQRHASLDLRPGGGYPTGMTVSTLCQRELSADNSELAWLWSTCRACNSEAHRIAQGVASMASSERNFRTAYRDESSVRLNTFERVPPRRER